MIQHTHTHSRAKKKDSSDLSDGVLSPRSVPDDNLSMHVPSVSNSSHRLPYAENQKLNLDRQKVLPYSYDQQPFMYYPPNYYQPLCPPSPAFDEEHAKYQPPCYAYPQAQPTWNSMYFAPINSTLSHHSSMAVPIPSTPVSSCSSESGSSYQPQRPTLSSVLPAADYCRKNSIHSETTHKRRLSHVELLAPIQELGSHYYNSPISTHTIREDESTFSSDDDNDEDYDERQMSPIDTDTVSTNKTNETRLKSAVGVDITEDEYEALQGFSKFCMEPIVMKETSVAPIQLPPLRKSNSRTSILSSDVNFPSGVYVFRQQSYTVPESFQRGAI